VLFRILRRLSVSMLVLDLWLAMAGSWGQNPRKNRSRSRTVAIFGFVVLASSAGAQSVPEFAVRLSFTRPCDGNLTISGPTAWQCSPETVTGSAGSVTIARNGNTSSNVITAALQSTLNSPDKGLFGTEDYVDVAVYTSKPLTGYSLQFTFRSQVQVQRSPAPTSGTLQAISYMNGSLMGIAEWRTTVNWSGSKDVTQNGSTSRTSGTQATSINGANYYQLGNLRIFAGVTSSWFSSTAQAISSLQITATPTNPAKSQFDVRIRAFIPPEVIEGPGVLTLPASIGPSQFFAGVLAVIDGEACVDSFGGFHPLYFGGDNRSIDPAASSYRFMTRAVVDYSGIVSGTQIQNDTGISTSYAPDAIAGPLTLTPAARTDPFYYDAINGTGASDCTLKHRIQKPDPSGISTTVNVIDSSTVEIHTVAAIRNPLVFSSGIGPIRWDLTLRISRINNQNVVTVNGTHTCYPAIEMWVNDTFVGGGVPTQNDIGTLLACLSYQPFPSYITYTNRQTVVP
jgi:hypothetical protein